MPGVNKACPLTPDVHKAKPPLSSPSPWESLHQIYTASQGVEKVNTVLFGVYPANKFFWGRNTTKCQKVNPKSPCPRLQQSEGTRVLMRENNNQEKGPLRLLIGEIRGPVGPFFLAFCVLEKVRNFKIHVKFYLSRYSGHHKQGPPWQSEFPQIHWILMQELYAKLNFWSQDEMAHTH